MKTLKDDNNKNNLSKNYIFNKGRTRTQGLSRRTGCTITAPLQIELHGSVWSMNILSI
jgi:hypothetical protein